jgi:hypothetical protein
MLFFLNFKVSYDMTLKIIIAVKHINLFKIYDNFYCHIKDST